MRVKRSVAVLIVTAVMLAVTADGRAAVLGTYTFDTGETALPTNGHVALTFAPFARGSSTTADTSAGVYRTRRWNNASLDVSRWVGFSVTVADGYRLLADDVSLSGYRNVNGPQSASLRSSHDNYATGTAFAPATSAQPVTGPTPVASTTGGSFRIFGWNTANQLGQFTVDDVTLNGNIQARASLQTSIAPAAARVIRGASGVRFSANVTNDAPAGGTTAAEGLDYSLSYSGGTGATMAPAAGSALAGGATAAHYVDVDTSSAGTMGGGTVAGSTTNGYRANGASGTTTTSHTLGTVDVLDHANGSIRAADDPSVIDQNELTYTFDVSVGDTAEAQFRIANLVADALLGAGFTADLRYVGQAEDDTLDKFTTTAGSFPDIAAGDDYLLTVAMDTSSAGTFGATYTFLVGDEALAGADATPQELTLNLVATVSAASTPEPGTMLLASIAGLALLRRRRLRARVNRAPVAPLHPASRVRRARGERGITCRG